MTEAMREPTYLLLTAMAAGRQHGYGLVQEVAELSGGRVRLRAGTLYGALDRLTAEGLIAADGEEVVAGRFRRYYVLSEDGARALAVETAHAMISPDLLTPERIVAHVDGFLATVRP
jgi:DNA-binding PadR family transcriptional regulator